MCVSSGCSGGKNPLSFRYLMAEDKTGEAPRVTRGQFIKGSLAAAALAFIGKFSGSGSQVQSADTPPVPDTKPTHTATAIPAPPLPTPKPKPEMKPLEKKEAIIERPNIVFGHYKGEDKEIVLEWTKKYIEEFKEDKTGIKQAKGLEQEIFNVAAILGVEKDSWSVKVLPALIFVETRGDPNRVSETGARGICQLMPKTATEVSASLPIETRKALGMGMPPNLLNNKVSIALSIKYLKQLLDQFFDPGLALLAYYEGMGSVDEDVKEYLLLTKTTTAQEIEKTEPDPRDPEKGFGYLINKHGVSYTNLKRRKANTDKDDYVLKTAAADEILSS